VSLERPGGIGRLLVGYRHDHRMLRYYSDVGLPVRSVRRCIGGCGYEVFFNPSGITSAHEKDPEVICSECYARYKPEVQRAL